MKLSELSPFPTFLKWEGAQIQLKPFSLRAITWAERFFFRPETDGFDRMNRILGNHEGQDVLFNSLIDIVYYLGFEGFDKIGFDSPDKIKAKVAESDKKMQILEEFKEKVEQIISDSFPKQPKRPEFKGGKRFEEITKGAGSTAQDNWDQIYVEFFRSGGMSIDDFMELTVKQIGPLISEIQHKRTEELHILSDLIHKKISIKKPRRQLPHVDFTEEDVTTFEKMHAKLVEQSRIH